MRVDSYHCLQAQDAYAFPASQYIGPHELALPTPSPPTRALATITYRSAPEWEGRFVTRQQPDQVPNFCPDFEVEHYLEAAGDRFCTSYDPNSLLYISKVSST